MFHLIQLLLKLLLQVEGDLPDNSRLVGSILIGGAWLILVAELFPDPLGVWRDWFLWVRLVCRRACVISSVAKASLEVPGGSAETEPFAVPEMTAIFLTEVAAGDILRGG